MCIYVNVHFVRYEKGYSIITALLCYVLYSVFSVITEAKQWVKSKTYNLIICILTKKWDNLIIYDTSTVALFVAEAWCPHTTWVPTLLATHGSDIFSANNPSLEGSLTPFEIFPTTFAPLTTKSSWNSEIKLLFPHPVATTQAIILFTTFLYVRRMWLFLGCKFHTGISLHTLRDSICMYLNVINVRKIKRGSYVTNVLRLASYIM